MKKLIFQLAAGISVLFITGCVSNNTQYYWGQYETVIYKNHIKPEEVPPITQIEILEADIAKANTSNKPVPPGVYAHLGLMYAAAGNKELAIASLNKEKELFPESTAFVDGLIERANK